VLKNELLTPDSNGAAVGMVSVVSTTTNMVLDTITVGVAPRALAVAPDGTYVYVVNGDGTISVIDTSCNINTASITVENIGLSSLAITPDGAYIYVAGLGEIFVINTKVVVWLHLCRGLGRSTVWL
jgi:YVTN family beta-propeller protein